MYTLGIPDRQKRRTLGYLKQNWIDFEERPAMEGFFDVSFPDMDEEAFRDITIKLKQQGVTLIGADEVLTENKIMKLTDLITEWSESSNMDEERPQLFPPGENGFVDLISALEKTLESWKSKYVGGFYTDEKNRADDYQIDLQELLEIYKDKAPKTKSSEMGDYDSKNLSEQKLRKLIRNLIRQ